MSMGHREMKHLMSWPELGLLLSPFPFVPLLLPIHPTLCGPPLEATRWAPWPAVGGQEERGGTGLPRRLATLMAELGPSVAAPLAWLRLSLSGPAQPTAGAGEKASSCDCAVPVSLSVPSTLPACSALLHRTVFSRAPQPFWGSHWNPARRRSVVWSALGRDEAPGQGGGQRGVPRRQGETRKSR